MVNISFTLILLEKQACEQKRKTDKKMQEAPGQGQMIYVMIIKMYRWRVGEARELQIPKVHMLDDLSYDIESAQVDCDDVG